MCHKRVYNSTTMFKERVKPTGRIGGQIRRMRAKVDEYFEPSDRGIAQLRTRVGGRIDRGR